MESCSSLKLNKGYLWLLTRWILAGFNKEHNIVVKTQKYVIADSDGNYENMKMGIIYQYFGMASIKSVDGKPFHKGYPFCWIACSINKV